MSVTKAPHRQDIRVEASIGGLGDFHLSPLESLENLLIQLQTLRATIPEECRASAQFHIGGDPHAGDGSFSVTYVRPETDAEYAERVARVKHADERTREYRRKQYEELQKEFGVDSSAKTKP